MGKPGRPSEERRAMYISRFNIAPQRKMWRFLTPEFMDQLDACKSDEARRILLRSDKR